MQNLVVTLLNCTVSMTVIALLCVALSPLLAKRYSVKSRYYAWLVIVVGFIIPFRPQFNNSVVKTVTTETTTPIIYVGNGATAINPIHNTGLPSNSFRVYWWQTALIVWLVGVIAFLAYQGLMHYRFMRTSKRWSVAITNERDLALLEKVKSEMGVANHIGFYQCDSVGSPMLVGVFSPRLLLPKGKLEQDELYFILKHELTHYRRKDLWYKCLVMMAISIHWFNPIVYLMARAIDTLCEISCDNEVIGSTDANMRLHYSEAIIGAVKYQSKMKSALSTNFYGGKNNMKKRIFSIMDTGRKRAGFVVICAALLLTLGTGAAFAVDAATMPDNDIPAGVKGRELVAANAQVATGDSWNNIYGGVIVMENGDELDLSEFTNQEDAYKAVKQYCSEQVGLGNMSQQKADDMLESISQQWDGWEETVTG